MNPKAGKLFSMRKHLLMNIYALINPQEKCSIQVNGSASCLRGGCLKYILLSDTNVKVSVQESGKVGDQQR